MRSDRGWIPDATDLDYVEGLAREPHPVLLEIERDAVPEGVPIVDRSSGRVLMAAAAGRRRIVEIGTAVGYSTLWMALGQPADGTIVTVDPDRSRTDRAREWWRRAGVAGRIEVVNRPALEALAADDAGLRGPFDLAFIDALKPEYERYLEALVPRLAPGALVLADNVLWSGRASGSRPDPGNGAQTEALRRFNAAVLADPRFSATILPVGDGLLIAGFAG